MTNSVSRKPAFYQSMADCFRTLKSLGSCPLSDPRILPRSFRLQLEPRNLRPRNGSLAGRNLSRKLGWVRLHALDAYLVFEDRIIALVSRTVLGSITWENERRRDSAPKLRNQIRCPCQAADCCTWEHYYSMNSSTLLAANTMLNPKATFHHEISRSTILCLRL